MQNLNLISNQHQSSFFDQPRNISTTLLFSISISESISTPPKSRMSTKTNEGQEENETADVLYKEEYKPWFLPLIVLFVPLLPLFWKYHVTITKEELSFGYSSACTSKRVKHRQTAIKEAIPLFDQKWSGFGIHYRPDSTHSFCGPWERLYICNNGGAVKMIIRNNKEEDDEAKDVTFYFSTNDPQKVSNILNEAV